MKIIDFKDFMDSFSSKISGELMELLNNSNNNTEFKIYISLNDNYKISEISTLFPLGAIYLNHIHVLSWKYTKNKILELIKEPYVQRIYLKPIAKPQTKII